MKQPVCRTYTAEQVAAVMGVGVDAVYRAAEDGHLKHLRFGRRIVFSQKYINDLADGIEAEPVAVPAYEM